MCLGLFLEQTANPKSSQSGIAHYVDIVGNETGRHRSVRARAIAFEFPAVKRARRRVSVTDASVVAEILGIARDSMNVEVSG